MQSLASIGSGCPDILVGYQGRTLLMEVKDGTKPPSAQKLTRHEKNWMAGWKGQCTVVTSAEEALRILLKVAGSPPVVVRSRLCSGSPGLTKSPGPDG